MVYLTLFVTSFLAATILPLHSELLLFALLATGHPPLGLWVVATLGNTLGSLSNWILGRYLLHYQDRSWFPVRVENLQKIQNYFQRFGVWSLLFAWLPGVGDALTFAAGILRVRWWLFLVLVSVGKGARYAFIIELSAQLLPTD